MKKILIRGALVAALMGSALSAHALTLNLTGFAQGSEAVGVSVPISSNVSAGAFIGSLSGAPGFNANPFLTYCVELTQNFSFGSPLPGYSIANGLSYFTLSQSASAAAAIVDRLGKLFTYLGGVGLPANSQTAAAIQIAVWESIYEGAANFNINPMSTSGTFQATASAGTLTLAASLLTSAAAVTTSMYSISVLENANAQDFLLIQQVSTPGTLALAALALSGLALVRRRQA